MILFISNILCKKVVKQTAHALNIALRFLFPSLTCFWECGKRLTEGFRDYIITSFLNIMELDFVETEASNNHRKDLNEHDVPLYMDYCCLPWFMAVEVTAGVVRIGIIGVFPHFYLRKIFCDYMRSSCCKMSLIFHCEKHLQFSQIWIHIFVKIYFMLFL